MHVSRMPVLSINHRLCIYVPWLWFCRLRRFSCLTLRTVVAIACWLTISNEYFHECTSSPLFSPSNNANDEPRVSSIRVSSNNTHSFMSFSRPLITIIVYDLRSRIVEKYNISITRKIYRWRQRLEWGPPKMWFELSVPSSANFSFYTRKGSMMTDCSCCIRHDEHFIKLQSSLICTVHFKIVSSISCMGKGTFSR